MAFNSNIRKKSTWLTENEISVIVDSSVQKKLGPNPGTLTNITAGTGLKGGSITTAGTIHLDAGLDDINNVELTTIDDNQGLFFDNGTNKWVNRTMLGD